MSDTSPPEQNTLPAFLRPLASLRLTLVLLGLSMVLVFVGTLAQVQFGIYHVQETYFRSFLVWLPLADTGIQIPILPGGFLLGWLLFFNLIAAHATRFKLTWRKSGLFLIHIGLIVLLLGEFFTAVLAEESMMRVDEGGTSYFSEAPREVELAVVDRSGEEKDRVYAFPESMLESGAVLSLPDLPLQLKIDQFYPNSRLFHRDQNPDAPPSPADRGVGPQLVVQPHPRATKMNERDLSSAFVEILGPTGSMGTYLLSNALAVPQGFQLGDRDFSIEIRQKRHYKPFSLSLVDFSHDRYAGTDIPKNFSSLVRLQHPAKGEDREVLIYMNHPLRYEGYTFFQASFDNNDTTSIFQVVQNPSWLLPYISCILVGVGLMLQFGISLNRFLSRRARKAAGAEKLAASPAAGLPWPGRLALVGVMVLVGISFKSGGSDRGFDLATFGETPVLLNGRIKPLDTVARNSLLVIRGKEYVDTESGRMNAMAWLTEVLFAPERAETRNTFLIHNEGVKDHLGLPEQEKYFDFETLIEHGSSIQRQAQIAGELEAPQRSRFQRDILQLSRQMSMFVALKNTLRVERTNEFVAEIGGYKELVPVGVDAFNRQAQGEAYNEDALMALGSFAQRYTRLGEIGHFFPIPPPEATAPRENWQKMGDALINALRGLEVPEAVERLAGMGDAYRNGEVDAFNELAGIHLAETREVHGEVMTKVGLEQAFNAFNPFGKAMTLYVLAFLAAVISWLKWPRAAAAAGFWLLVGALLIHSLGILARMWLEGRPPVTNLYSSAVFIGWGVVVLGLLLERMFRNGVGTVAAASLGFATLIIARGLSMDGDTMEMMRAVLDSNFWLATHVIVITLGYSATFLAGALAIIYIVRGTLTPSLDGGTGKSLGRMVYGIVCFATLFSFVGTVLGGIWADQSWGRFWGWDPKENGALLIVLWNAIILHAKWGRYVGDRGVAVLAVFGNIVTSWSWFGTNMLGVGLHSYGFMDAAFMWLAGFIATQIAVMALGSLPIRLWRSRGLAA